MLSANVPYYILDLLQQVSAVYVQGLGRFEAIFHPAVIDLPQSRIKPPYVEPEFRYDLESPSEILPRYIAYVAGPGAGSPQEAIDEFVRKVFEQTENGMLYPIEKFGTFSRSGSGQIRFTPDWDAFNLSFSGLEILDLKEPNQVKNGSEAYFAPPVDTYIPPVASTTVITPKEEEETRETEAAEEKPQSPQEPVTPHQVLIDESTSRLWWIILTSAIILIAVLCAYLAWDIISNRDRLDELKRIYPDTATIPIVKDSLPLTDTTQAPVIAEPEDTATSVVTTPPPVEPEEVTSPCYVVVGAFSEQPNVATMVERLESLGYTVEQIRGGSLTRVAIRTGCEPDNLQKVLNEARSTINPEAWIY